jgi:phage-related protein
MDPIDKAVVWLHGEIKTPPFSPAARIEAGFLLRKLQIGEKLSLPQSRPMPVIGKRCHELRITDRNVTWRIVYRIDTDAIIILEVFEKKTAKTPKNVIDVCKDRLRDYDETDQT